MRKLGERDIELFKNQKTGQRYLKGKVSKETLDAVSIFSVMLKQPIYDALLCNNFFNCPILGYILSNSICLDTAVFMELYLHFPTRYNKWQNTLE